MAYAAKVLTEYGRNQDSNITRLVGMARSPAGLRALVSRRRDGRRRTTRGPRYDDVDSAADERGARRRRSRARRGNRLGRARAGSGTRTCDRRRSCSTASSSAATTRSSCPGSCGGCSSRGRTAAGRNTQENAMALESLVAYYKKFEAETPNMTATVALGDRDGRHRGVPRTDRRRRRAVRLAMPDLLRQVAAGAEADLVDLARGHRQAVLHRAAAVRPVAAAAAERSGHARRAPLREVSSRTATARRARRSAPAI